jgi:hypothetical protein
MKSFKHWTIFTKIMSISIFTIVSCFLLGTAYAQSPDVDEPVRIDIGGRFSIARPVNGGWQAAETPGSYRKRLEPQGHTLVFTAVTGPSGISQKDIQTLQGSGGGNRLVKLVTRFTEDAWKAHNSGLQGGRFEKIDAVNDTNMDIVNAASEKDRLNKFICAYSRIRVYDREAIVDGRPTQMRYVAYTCIEFPDMTVAAHVSYSERGREQDLSEDALTEGERMARSLQRKP